MTTYSMKITFLIRSLDYGGAERQLVLLANGLHQLGHSVSVIVFYSGGPLIPELLKQGIKVHSAGKKHRWDLFGFLCRMISIVRAERPDVIHSYLTVSNILAIILRWFCHQAKVVWGIRASDMDVTRYDTLWKVADWIEKKSVKFADMVIVNSKAGMSHSAKRGIQESKLTFIANGIDTETFKPGIIDQDLRCNWGISFEEHIIGMVARFDPMKDHTTFISAAALVHSEFPSLRFVLVGEGPAGYVHKIKQLAKSVGVADLVVFAKTSSSMAKIYRSFDLMTLTSEFGEGFPNVVGEAMACGISCVVTDVGDSSLIVGSTGYVVPKSDPVALAKSWRKFLTLPLFEQKEFGKHARNRIVKAYSAQRMIKETEKTLLQLI